MTTLREPNFWMFVGRAPQKKIKGLVFLKDKPTPVWDIKTDRLIRRLPYMRPAESPYMLKPQTAPKGPQPKPPAAIPPNWREAHHKRRMAWAGTLSTEHVKSASMADAIIAAHLGEPVQAEAA